MNYSKNLRKKHLTNSMDNLIAVENIYMNLGFLIIAVLIGIHSFEVFTNLIAIFIAMLGFLVLFTALIKENYSRGEGFALTGIAFGISSVFYLSIVCLNLDQNFNYDTAAKLVLASGYFQGLGILLSVIFANKKVKTKKFFYLFLSGVVILQAIIHYVQPTIFFLYAENKFTILKNVSDLGLLLFYAIILVIVFFKRKYLILDKNRICLFFIISNLLASVGSTVFLNLSSIMYLICQLMALLSYTLLYSILAN
ncbi:MAG: hypothetical protein GX370_12165, partial [Clostridia bacterium]|nr:hypothetical protein [Clostridia bacterium]